MRNPYARHCLDAGTLTHQRCEVLRPAQPTIYLDRDYILYAVGLLAEPYPAIAAQLFQRRVLATGRASPAHPATAHHDHDDCCEGEHTHAWAEETRWRR